MKRLRILNLLLACGFALMGNEAASAELCDCGSMVCDNDFVWSAWYEDGLYRIDKASLEVEHFDAKELGIGSGIIPDVAVDPNDGSLWLTSKTIRIYNLKDGVLTHIENQGVGQNYLHIRFSPSKELWIYGPSFVDRYFEGSWHDINYNSTDLVVMSNWCFRNIAWDPTGDLWAFTSYPEYAILHISNYVALDTYEVEFNVEEYDVSEYYKFNPQAVAVSTEGKALLTTIAKLILFDLESKEFSTYDYCEGAGSNSVTCAQYDHNGIAWIAGKGMVSTFDGEKNEKVNIEGLEDGEKVISLLPDGDDVWLATNTRNFYLLRNGEVQRLHAGVKDLVSVTSSTASNPTIYNLQGQRVVNPIKGTIYIHDGKKIVW